jgi:hypothetical protein
MIRDVKIGFVVATILLCGADPGRAQERPTTAGDRRSAFETVTGEPFAEAEGEAGEMETDRDAFTPASSVVGRRRFVVESAYSFLENRRSYETHSLPELLLRYGLTERVELRFGFNYEVGGGSNEISGSGSSFHETSLRGERLERETQVTYGAKVRLTDQNQLLPRSALILQGATPTGGSEGSSTATQLIATGVTGWELPNRWRIDTALRFGTASEEGERFERWAPSGVLRVPLGERAAAHVEYFGVFTTREGSADQHYVSYGAHTILGRELEVGFRLGWGLNDRSVRFFSNVGIGYRF